MTYEELKAAYEAAVQKCSELEKENDELKKSNEDQALHIEHLEEQILKRNKMLFGQKSEKSKFICNGQMDLDGNVFNEAEELSNLSAAEPTEESTRICTLIRRRKEKILAVDHKRLNGAFCKIICHFHFGMI